MAQYEPPKEAVSRPHRLLPAVLEHVARTDPQRIYAAIPKEANLDHGLRLVTFTEVLKAIDSFAWFLENNVGVSSSFDTLTYVGVDDLRYVVFFFACIKTGHKVDFEAL